MKKYEAPIVELTKFDVEDVITASAETPATIDVTQVDAGLLEGYAADIKAATGNGLNDVFSW